MRSRRQRLRAATILGGCSLYLAMQIALIVRGHFSESKHFAFWMFPEATLFTARLSRELTNGVKVDARRGIWRIGPSHDQTTYEWHVFVRDYNMNVLNATLRSKGTFADTERYFQAALDYVADRIPKDTITNRLLMRIDYRKAGQESQRVDLQSKARFESESQP